MSDEYYIDIGSILEVVLQSLLTEECVGFVYGMHGHDAERSMSVK